MAKDESPKPASVAPVAPAVPLPGPSNVEHVTITKGLIPPLKRTRRA
jgi:hypothetical protein